MYGGQVLPLVMPSLWLTLALGVAGGRVWERRVTLGVARYTVAVEE